MTPFLRLTLAVAILSLSSQCALRDEDSVSNDTHTEHKERPDPSPWPYPVLPNPPVEIAGLPDECSFYEYDEKRYPNTLLVKKRVSVLAPNLDALQQFLLEALREIREHGSSRFPRVSEIAVIVRNVREHQDRATFASSHKVGAVFPAKDVFDRSVNLSLLVREAELDWQPFGLEGNEQRWFVVERQ